MLRCPICNGAAHPATGCEYTPTFVVCWRCTLEGWEWLRNHINGKSRGRKRSAAGVRAQPAFYDHVGWPKENVDK